MRMSVMRMSVKNCKTERIVDADRVQRAVKITLDFLTRKKGQPARSRGNILDAVEGAVAQLKRLQDELKHAQVVAARPIDAEDCDYCDGQGWKPRECADCGVELTEKNVGKEDDSVCHDCEKELRQEA